MRLDVLEYSASDFDATVVVPNIDIRHARARARARADNSLGERANRRADLCSLPPLPLLRRHRRWYRLRRYMERINRYSIEMSLRVSRDTGRLKGERGLSWPPSRGGLFSFAYFSR